MKRAAIAVAVLIVFATVSLRGWEHTLTALPHLEAQCPKATDAILVLGQSHASNTGTKRQVAWERSYSFDREKCFYLRDPMPGTAGNGGSIWPSFAEFTENPVVIADMAISGSAIEQWTTETQLRKIRRTLAAMKRAGYSEPLVVWMQGETNAARRTGASTYNAELEKLIAVAPRLKWLIVRESVCDDVQVKWRPLDEARDKLAREHANVVIGPDLDHIPARLRQEDRCHLTPEGQNLLARQLAESAKPLLSN
ncbi:MAG: hypothetical protein J0H88_08305 [Sphingomonadales bacterium]|nr:hypothetical protein [Sphingomonadales bacterium]